MALWNPRGPRNPRPWRRRAARATPRGGGGEVARGGEVRRRSRYRCRRRTVDEWPLSLSSLFVASLSNGSDSRSKHNLDPSSTPPNRLPASSTLPISATDRSPPRHAPAASASPPSAPSIIPSPPPSVGRPSFFLSRREPPVRPAPEQRLDRHGGGDRRARGGPPAASGTAPREGAARNRRERDEGVGDGGRPRRGDEVSEGRPL